MERIKYKRICECCGKEFMAEKSSTRFCSNRCSKRAYKQRLRMEITEALEKDKARLEEIKRKEEEKSAICVSLAAKYLGVSRSTLYRYLRSGFIKCVQMPGKTLIRKGELDKLFDGSNGYIYIQRPKSRKRDRTVPLLTIREIAQMYNYSIAGAYKAMHDKNVEPIRDGQLLYYSIYKVQEVFEQLMKNDYPEIKEWWTAVEIAEIYGKSLDSIYSMVSEHGVPCKVVKRKHYYSKEHVEKIYTPQAEMEKSKYYSTSEAMSRYDLTAEQFYWIVSQKNVPRFKIGKGAHYLKSRFDEAMKELGYIKDRKPSDLKREDCYSPQEIMKKYKVNYAFVYRFAYERKISKIKIGVHAFYSKKEFDEEMKSYNPERVPKKK